MSAKLLILVADGHVRQILGPDDLDALVFDADTGETDRLCATVEYKGLLEEAFAALTPDPAVN